MESVENTGQLGLFMSSSDCEITVPFPNLSLQIKGSFQMYYERKFFDRSKCVLYQNLGPFKCIRKR